ncbi:hypothetical protein NP233_g2348 [Leucocoprinus birnbaumii]|uniref:Calpain catalytic domain-containing protein n=1 Tax=Leucocoprinus birnbaumii TaxID=56174 RepID=A0AAD5YTU2_9AGAR|nr:hypothetical protein NP233_g2348 [Leucocoprinus birnbaumii]
MARKHWQSLELKKEETTTSSSVLTRHEPKIGFLVTEEFEKALSHCKAEVYQIAKDCRAKNRKFRDIDFDLDNDRDICYHGLIFNKTDLQPLTSASRATDIYYKPQFFIDGPDTSNIVQGDLGDCWFLSALSNLSAPCSASTRNNLIEQTCVARDENVGVYGFAFFKNGAWVTVIIDDLLFCKTPKFEELRPDEKDLFHGDKKKYNKNARKGSGTLCFARSGTENETWVPLIEKAYAKLHGDYSSLEGDFALIIGFRGVSSTILTKDILDPDRFWTDELLRTNHDRLFNAAYDEYQNSRNPKDDLSEIEGLIGGHSYSILKAIEVGGKRFLMMRNPWGKSEWTGPWSDGSREWTPEWLARLPEMGHQFGNDGQFLMEYSDFLDYFDQIDRVILFDETWRMSMQWLQVPIKPPPAAKSFGDVTFDFTITTATKAVIVLSQLDNRYFKGREGLYRWNIQFMLYRLDTEDAVLVSQSEHGAWLGRSVNTEVYLNPGNYTVQARIEGFPYENHSNSTTGPHYTTSLTVRKLGRVLTELTQAQSAALNYKPGSYDSTSRTKQEYAFSFDQYYRDDAGSTPCSMEALIKRARTAADRRSIVVYYEPKPASPASTYATAPSVIDGKADSLMAGAASEEEEFPQEITEEQRARAPSNTKEEKLESLLREEGEPQMEGEKSNGQHAPNERAGCDDDSLPNPVEGDNNPTPITMPSPITIPPLMTTPLPIVMPPIIPPSPISTPSPIRVPRIPVITRTPSPIFPLGVSERGGRPRRNDWQYGQYGLGAPAPATQPKAQDVFIGLRIYTQGWERISIVGTVGREEYAETFK